ERQWMSPSLFRVQRSRRANRPSRRGRERPTREPSISSWGMSRFPCASRTQSPSSFSPKNRTRTSPFERREKSHSAPSASIGSPFSVLREIDGSDRLHPNPNGLLPVAESYERESCGPKPDRPGEVAIGTDIAPAPVVGLAANFSPVPRIAPPPFGKEIA